MYWLICFCDKLLLFWRAENVILFVVVFKVTHSRDTYQDLVRLMEQHRADRAVQLSILRYWPTTAARPRGDLWPRCECCSCIFFRFKLKITPTAIHRLIIFTFLHTKPNMASIPELQLTIFIIDLLIIFSIHSLVSVILKKYVKMLFTVSQSPFL